MRLVVRSSSYKLLKSSNLLLSKLRAVLLHDRIEGLLLVSLTLTLALSLRRFAAKLLTSGGAQLDCAELAAAYKETYGVEP